MTALIGLSGYARAGKDSIGEQLVLHHGYSRRAFADKLRDLAYEINPEIVTQRGVLTYRTIIDTYGYEAAKNQFEGIRPMLVAIGAGARKVLGGGVWLDATLPNLHGVALRGWQRNNMPTAVTDVRYLNEAQRIVQLGGEVWYVDRPGVNAANEEEQRTIAEVLKHVSVRVFCNDGAFNELSARVAKFLGVV